MTQGARGFGRVLGVIASVALGSLSVAPAWASGIIAQFQGGAFGQSGFVPPDMGGGVGDGYVVQLLNGVATIDTTAGSLVSQTSLNSFFGGSGTQLSDPRVIFDPTSQRWFASVITVPGGSLSSQNSILLAVSSDANPTSGFTTLSFLSANSTSAADYPTLGVNNAAVTIGTNDFSTTAGTYIASSLYSIPKSSLTAPTPALTGMASFTQSNQVGFTPEGVTNTAGTGTSTSVLSTGVNSAGTQLVYALSTVAGANTAGATLALTQTYNQPFSNSLIAPTQPGGTTYDSGGTRIGSGAYQSGSNIYFANTVSNGSVDEIAWNVLNATTSSLSTGLIGISGLDLTYGSISANANGTFVVTFNGSGTSQNITDYYVICSSVTNTCGTPQVACTSPANNYNLVAGGRNRWGDYSWTTVDPNNPNNFWLFQEYASSNSSWATVITEIGTAASSAAPEPGAASVLAVGLLGLLASRRRRRAGG